MKLMISLSLLLNVAVLVPVCAGMVRGSEWVIGAYGSDSPARRILLSVYGAICAASGALLLVPDRVDAIAVLLAQQVVYKLTTPFTVGSLSNPVVRSNVGIAVFHTVTLGVIVLQPM